MSHYDVIVIGTGSMGSAACYWLSKKGLNTLGLDQFSVPHEHGSHTGQSRIIRKAYFEHPDYVPLLELAYRNWKELEQETGEKLYFETGLLYMGPRGHSLLDGVLNSAAIYQVPLAERGSPVFPREFPPFQLPDHFATIFEPAAGFLKPEKAISLMIEAATRHGCTIRSEEKLIEWKKEGNHYSLKTSKGNYSADKLVFTAGPWTSQVLRKLPAKLVVTRQVIAWVQPPKPAPFMLGRFPCWLLEDENRGIYYGFPIPAPGTADGMAALKLAHHFPGDPSDPDLVDRSIRPDDEEDIRYALDKYLPAAGQQIVEWKTCLYTNSADENFIIDHLPDSGQNITIACGFSGHGFKFATAIGQIISELVIDGKSASPIDFLRLQRFGQS